MIYSILNGLSFWTGIFGIPLLLHINKQKSDVYDSCLLIIHYNVLFIFFLCILNTLKLTNTFLVIFNNYAQIYLSFVLCAGVSAYIFLYPFYKNLMIWKQSLSQKYTLVFFVYTCINALCTIFYLYFNSAFFLLLWFLVFYVLGNFQLYAYSVEIQKRIVESSQIINQMQIENTLHNWQNQHIKLQKLRHDLRNKMLIIHNLLIEEKYEEILSYLEEEYTINALNYSNNVYTQNLYIDSFFNAKIEENPEIHFSFESISLRDTTIETNDLLKIIANLLNNAIEAIIFQKIENTTIQLCIKKENNILYISCANPSKMDPAIHQFKSNKKNHTYHGYGLQIIKDTVQKYHGLYQYEYENGIFTYYISMQEN